MGLFEDKHAVSPCFEAQIRYRSLLCDSLFADAIPFRESSQALLTILHRPNLPGGGPLSLWRCHVNLSHNAALHAWPHNEPSNAGTKD